MKGEFILISGSASDSCPEAGLDRAVEFVEHLVGEVLRRGGRIGDVGIRRLSNPGLQRCTPNF